ncbi:MAG TPA: TIGR04283 family arsenosugar biosynthesis glycosyltransferase [Thermoanaerobaculia bacterium]|nr:TIGR04283 family arsenosugar biosynthesis glycosyltransferase [Thermoanaerobaculia bacterium]
MKSEKRQESFHSSPFTLHTSIIIPTLNEEERIGATIESAFAAGAAEVIVVDGGSVDRTARFAKSAGARVLLGEAMRARQLNLGASAAVNDVLIFLHADTLLPRGAAHAVGDALAGGADFGGFRIAFAEPARKLRMAAVLINLRTAITRCPWGDQAQFIRRERFLQTGGFREIPLMEDYDLAIRMKKLGRPIILPLTVTTSGRRFLRKGVLRTAMINWRTVMRFRRGADVAELARSYRR